MVETKICNYKKMKENRRNCYVVACFLLFLLMRALTVDELKIAVSVAVFILGAIFLIYYISLSKKMNLLCIIKIKNPSASKDTIKSEKATHGMRENICKSCIS